MMAISATEIHAQQPFLGAIRQRLQQPVSIAPLVVFRVLFGLLMFAATMRFAVNGWISELYIQPQFFFSYYGFEWIQPLGGLGMHLLFGIMALSAIGIMLGYRYRLSAVLFFLAFTYIELLDKTNYLNHYYFVSLMSLLLIFLPANHAFSLDALRLGLKPQLRVPRLTVGTVRLQLAFVYFFAGVAKLNPDWMLEALPLRIWLPAQSHLPLIGGLLQEEYMAYAFSWAGAAYDLFIPFLLIYRPLRSWAYVAVVGFHLLTAWMFPIGMFPYIMICCTLVFFPAVFHNKIIRSLQSVWNRVRPKKQQKRAASQAFTWPMRKLAFGFVGFFFLLQAVLPLRHLLYPGHLFWTEQGYRFSWRVMLMEKAGYAIFKVRDPETGREGEATVSDYLTPNQEKMMATQPDMILQFAHFLDEQYREQGISDPEIRVESYVTLQGEGSRLFIDPSVDLSKLEDGFTHKTWILPYERESLQ